MKKHNHKIVDLVIPGTNNSLSQPIYGRITFYFKNGSLTYRWKKITTENKKTLF